ncbi:MAG: aromatic amino acid ammonia-lyase [Prevotellaceae bacterium]|jgi:histidine ammonia-lyase|nr:aromatic amino acid ammonia-lyase [Prevotellaceae bacterium]
MICIDGHSLNITDLHRLIYEDYFLYVDKDALEKVAESHRFLKEFAKNKLIYGINTGFGPMAQYRVDDARSVDLQYNIIRSHSAGLNEYLKKDYAKAVLINLLNSMLRGYSGVHTDLIHVIVAMVMENVIPCIPLHGGVGASGDLVQMAHVALNIIGEGEVYCGDTVMPAAEAFRLKSINPLKIRIREGIAIMNGTTAMTAVAALNVHRAETALEWSLALSACMNEMMRSYDDHYSDRLNDARQQSGQHTVARTMKDFLKDASRIKPREQLYGQLVEDRHIEHKIQPFYSLRCIPQILGPVCDTLAFARTIVENELNSTTDNPVVDVATQNVYHGGNFHGDYISLEMDKLKLVMTRVGMLSERQLNYLMNPAINGCLKPFVNSGIPGLNFGFQGIQFAATSTAAENQALSASNYVHSIPNNNDNQDIVSMGFNAACAAGKVTDNVFEILAVQAAAVLQGIDMLECKDELSTKSRKIYSDLRSIFAPLNDDRSTRHELMKLKEFMMFNPLQILFER